MNCSFFLGTYDLDELPKISIRKDPNMEKYQSERTDPNIWELTIWTNYQKNQTERTPIWKNINPKGLTPISWLLVTQMPVSTHRFCGRG
jgi:hypothetical protein